MWIFILRNNGLKMKNTIILNNCKKCNCRLTAETRSSRNNICKECSNKYSRDNRKKNREESNKYVRNYTRNYRAKNDIGKKQVKFSREHYENEILILANALLQVQPEIKNHENILMVNTVLAKYLIEDEETGKLF